MQHFGLFLILLPLEEVEKRSFLSVNDPPGSTRLNSVRGWMPPQSLLQSLFRVYLDMAEAQARKCFFIPVLCWSPAAWMYFDLGCCALNIFSNSGIAVTDSTILDFSGHVAQKLLPARCKNTCAAAVQVIAH